MGSDERMQGWTEWCRTAGSSGRATRGAGPGRLTGADERYRNLVERLPLVTYTDATDERSSAMFMSPQIELLLGYSVEEWLADPELFRKLVHPDDRERVLAEVARSNETGEPFHSEYRLIARDGRTVWVRDEAVHVLDVAGRPLYAQGYLLDITRNKAAEGELQRLASIVASSEDAIVTTTPEANIITWNPGAERIYGYAADEIVGQDVSALVPAERLPEARQILDTVKRGEAVRHLETVRLTKDGRRIDVSLSVSPVIDGHGKLIAISSIGRDITAAKQAREEADRLRTEFIGMISHELRNPLTSIKGYADCLLEIDGGELPGGLRDNLELIRRNAERIERLADDLLLVAHAETGEFALEMRAVDLQEIVAGCVESARPGAEEKGVDLAYSPARVARCLGDGQRLEQLLDNLLSNAIKYTPTGRRVEVRLRQAGDRSLIEVEDTGPGIRSADCPRVFERFFRGAAASGGEVPGVGVGLTIAKAIAEAHGGRISLASVEGVGSTFRVELPDRGLWRRRRPRKLGARIGAEPATSPASSL